jgi:hypothetical protein
MVADHYLTVKQWHPNFDPNEAMIDKMAMKYHDNAVLCGKLGDTICKTLKVDKATSICTSGNFARICVEVDLMKPLLLSKFKLRRRPRRIVHEGLHLICFQCGQYGHKKDACLRK